MKVKKKNIFQSQDTSDIKSLKNYITGDIKNRGQLRPNYPFNFI